MKLAVFSLFLFCIICCNEVTAWVATIPPSENTTKTHCYSEHYDAGFMKKGESKRVVDDCVQLSCLSDGTISVTGCGVLQVDPPCKVITPGDLSKPHPECCHIIKCPEGSNHIHNQLK